ncbi:MAG: glutaredoxin family protein [Sideroxyarcus sp.]|nr:glutaredoxin family protein [Sideroxyarcus sp.]
MKPTVILLAFCLATSTQAGELYRSIDAQGKVHYSDRPLAGTDDVEQLRLGKPSAPDDNLPYETRRAKENFPVTLYVTENCGAPCDAARQLLQQRGIPFGEKMIHSEAELIAFHKASGANRVPAATVGKTWLHGFLATEWNQELDIVGYPKSALSRPRPSP